MKSRIIYEDKQIIVCHKPAGVPVQSSRVSTPDMVSILKNHLAQERTSGSRKPSPAGQAPYLAVIHRLDQPVEGLLVCCRKGTEPSAHLVRLREVLSCRSPRDPFSF